MPNYLDILPGTDIQCHTAIAPLRAEPGEGSELESQILYGQTCHVLESGNKDWIRIRNMDDNYEGWTDRKHFSPDVRVRKYFVSDPVRLTETAAGIQYLPFGSRLSEQEIFPGTHTVEAVTWDTGAILHYATLFRNAPYLWGGKTILGIDCSGFMQILCSLFSVNLPRNASQQALCGIEVPYGSHQAGDLAFFTNENGKIVHVGILADMYHIWHASGKVRHDLLTQEGIIHNKNKKLTHKLHGIRRIT